MPYGGTVIYDQGNRCIIGTDSRSLQYGFGCILLVNAYLNFPVLRIHIMLSAMTQTPNRYLKLGS